MGRIQSSIGLITGLPILDTVDKLMAVSARPRDMLQARTDTLQKEQGAIATLTARILAVQFALKRLTQEEAFAARSVTSSHPQVLGATVSGKPAVGSYQFTPLQAAHAHQLLSSGAADADAALGPGSLTLRLGGYIDEGISLDRLNDGRGVQRGKIRITDRSGASAVIDLSHARTVDDVLAAINAADGINITAAAVGDRLRLVDHTGQAAANLRVQEVGAGSTAADLGLAGINTADQVALGDDVLRLYAGLSLSQLNGGTGVRMAKGADLTVTFRDGSEPLTIDFDPAADRTLADILRKLNEADPARLSAQISGDGDRLLLTDLTDDQGGTFSVAAAGDSGAAYDLGLLGNADGATIAGRRLQPGLKTALLANLGGGKGLGTLGAIQLTDRLGTQRTIDLSAAETLDDVLDAINSAGLEMRASVNRARNGILLNDIGGSGGGILAASADATASAEKLGIVASTAVRSVDGGPLHRQIISRQTPLSNYHRGGGIPKGSFLLTGSNGQTHAVAFDPEKTKTVGELIDLINQNTVGVRAEINATGDGIALVDTAGGGGAITVRDVGGNATAAALRLAGTSKLAQIGGQSRQVIDGSTTVRIEIAAGDSLKDVIAAINASGGPFTASLTSEGAGATPYRIMLSSTVPGKAGELLIDARDAPFDFQEIVAARDALVLLGSSGSAGAGVLASSPDGIFHQLIDGVRLTVKEPAAAPVRIEVRTSNDKLVEYIQTFVDQYNQLRDKLGELTNYNAEDNTVGLLFASSEALRIDTDLGRMLTSAFFGVGAIRSLATLGVSVRDNGKLEFDRTRLAEQFAANPDDVRQFFLAEERGFVAKMDRLFDQIAGAGNSLLINRTVSLQAKIDLNLERIRSMNVRLENERQRLLKDFYNMELAIGKMQNNLSAIESIQALPPLALFRTRT